VAYIIPMIATIVSTLFAFLFAFMASLHCLHCYIRFSNSLVWSLE